MHKIVKDRKQLSKPCVPCKSLQEGESLGKLLLSILERCRHGVGLAANQVGINKRVCVINVRRPIILVNPRIVGKFNRFNFKEGCLSFPGDYILTERHSNIVVKDDYNKELLYFDASDNALECACVQHEIDHLDGITMFEKSTKGEKDVENE